MVQTFPLSSSPRVTFCSRLFSVCDEIQKRFLAPRDCLYLLQSQGTLLFGCSLVAPLVASVTSCIALFPPPSQFPSHAQGKVHYVLAVVKRVLLGTGELWLYWYNGHLRLFKKATATASSLFSRRFCLSLCFPIPQTLSWCCKSVYIECVFKCSIDHVDVGCTHREKEVSFLYPKVQSPKKKKAI